MVLMVMLHKVTYTIRTIPDICQHLQKLGQYIQKVFIPALIDGHIPNNVERKLLSLPVKLRGMGIVFFADTDKTEYQNSRNITESLAKLHLEQTTKYKIIRDQLEKLKYNIKKEKLQLNTERLQSLIIDLPTKNIRLNKINQVKGASTWILTLPLKEERCSSLKHEFLDLRYGWPLSRLPDMCSCKSKYDLQHSLSCKKGGFMILRHNNHLNNISESPICLL